MLSDRFIIRNTSFKIELIYYDEILRATSKMIKEDLSYSLKSCSRSNDTIITRMIIVPSVGRCMPYWLVALEKIVPYKPIAWRCDGIFLYSSCSFACH